MTMQFDTSELERALAGLDGKVRKGAERGMHDATDDLLRVSRDLAPLDKGTLRTTAWKDVEEADGLVIGEVYYSAVEQGAKGRVNYALITHELGDTFANPTTPGTQPKYLERPLKENADEYERMIAEEIRKELK
ncbi:HK97 gp10 family phage protein [Paenibacillus sp. J5C_2022]|uniref:HK97 gp10 family phage protein n=1 Tax=Paenibacillus sp. J5C2022 TaxID=2977129 RepID=UPI0021D2F100|nr:HK97 gp10 family phage protein [Paenibacillus sp. J5C2022]MCU6709354.1 HK97 gp10 family phage protein [Paenibacillus sp. J5C2022]